MRKHIFAALLLISCNAITQTTVQTSRILYGRCTVDSLYNQPFSEWFKPGYESYKPNETTVADLKKLTMNDITIEIFFGSWCGDSKREVPNFMSLLNAISFPESKVKLIGVGTGDSLKKQSPQHEERGKGIFRVPTFIVYKNGVEINRINEYPVLSLEKDLLQIFNNQFYTPNYKSFSFINTWQNDGTFKDVNISNRNLAGQLTAVVKNENELNSVGHLLLSQGSKLEAINIFQINYFLFPESANVVSSLGEGYLENNEIKSAIYYLERSLKLNKNPEAVDGILSVLYKAKAKEKS